LVEHGGNTCPETLVSCPYHECGCCEKIPRRLLLSHLDKNTKLHLQLVLKVVGKQQQEITSLKKELNIVKERNVSFLDCVDNTIDSTIRWLQKPDDHPKVHFNLMYLLFAQLLLLLVLVYNGIYFTSQQYLVVTSYCIFMGYFYFVQQMEDISWFLQLAACIYFNAAWAFLVYVCI